MDNGGQWLFQKSDLLKERSKVLLDLIYTQGQINEIHQNGIQNFF